MKREEKQGILKERARRYAEEPPKKPAGEYLEVIEFSLNTERYAFETVFVREVCQLKDIVPLPGTPLFVSGIMNVRGQIMPVIDIRVFFDLPAKGLTDLNRVIILRDEGEEEMEFGVLADAIAGVRSISVGDIQPALPTLTGIRERYLRGVTEGGVVILDAGRLLSDKSIVVHEEV